MLYNLVIAPIEIIIDWVFNFITIKFTRFGIIGAVCGVSLVINFLALPLYNIADALQERERKAAKLLEPRVKRIKKAFKGNEQFMMLSTYYRQNDYHPLYVLRSSLSILIEIPFFIAAFHYLNNCNALRDSSFWIFKDLGSPDGLLHIGNFPIHVLPILMTLINFVSGAIYTKEAPFREKIQLYIVACLFLVLLYTSPSGLVIYWILNNLFSLVKNIVMKTKNPGKILHIALSAIFLLVSAYCIFNSAKLWKSCLILCFALAIVFGPSQIKKINLKDVKASKFDLLILAISGLGLAVLTGYLLPASIIASSPLEFSYIGNTTSPLEYINISWSVFTGLFFVWPVVIYFLFNDKVKCVETVVMFVAFLTALANAYIFKYNYGDLNLSFEIENPIDIYNFFYIVVPVLFLSVIALLVYISFRFKKKNFVAVFSFSILSALFLYGTLKVNGIKKEFKNFPVQYANTESVGEISNTDKLIHFSKTNNNVVVLFMDRAIGCYLPHFLDQFPEYADSFNGFINYSNTLSFGAYTLTGSPGIMGGYEYTPEAMGERSNLLLKTKFNESAILLPKIFSEKGYEITVISPPWANFNFNRFKDYSVYKENIADIRIDSLIDKYSNEFYKEKNLSKSQLDVICKKQIKNFCLMQILPPVIRKTFYADCATSLMAGLIDEFITNYSGLYYLKNETCFDASKPTYFFMDNETIHTPIYMENDFEKPTSTKNRNTGNYKTASDIETQLYEVFCASFIKLAQYFDYLRENGIWDNTRIIIVSDHGYHIKMKEYENFNSDLVPSSFDCLLMFKDFNQNSELKNDSSFMTNADTVPLAIKNLDVSDINPFTGNKLVPNKENGINLYFQIEGEIQAPDVIDKTNITLVKETAWHFIPGDINNPANWLPLTEWEKSNGGKN